MSVLKNATTDCCDGQRTVSSINNSWFGRLAEVESESEGESLGGFIALVAKGEGESLDGFIISKDLQSAQLTKPEEPLPKRAIHFQTQITNIEYYRSQLAKKQKRCHYIN